MNSQATFYFKLPHKSFSPFRIVVLRILYLALIFLSACSSTAKHHHTSSNNPDQSKIHVKPFVLFDNTVLPSADAANQLTQNITNQLAMENRLQTQVAIESLTMYGGILSYQDATLDVQAELYAGEEFLAYSRVRQQIAQPTGLTHAVTLISEQLLDELISKIRDQPHSQFGEYYQPDPDNKQTGTPKNDSYYQHWGWWRNRQDTPDSLPETHWDADGKIAPLPRSNKVIGDMTARLADTAKISNAADDSSTVLKVLGVIGVLLLFALAAVLSNSEDSKTCSDHVHHYCSPSRH